MMTFDDIHDGALLYLDANILIYFFNGKSLDCVRLLERCKRQQVFGVISTLTVIEVCHKAMCFEAEELTGKPRVTAEYLKRHPDLVCGLRKYATVVDDLLTRNNLQVIEVTSLDIVESYRIRQGYGLLTTDSITAQVLVNYDIPAIATKDPDFERIKGIQVFRPSDI